MLSGVGLLVSAPFWAVVAAAVKLEDGGPVFFAQARVGLGGRRFRALKFRSMIPDAGRPASGGGRDPRVTRIGRILRATAMDELPQLWNIFRGDMSFVGPRPLGPARSRCPDTGVHRGGAPGFAARHAWCVRGSPASRDVRAPPTYRGFKFRYDRLYIWRPALWLDLRLIALSFWISGRGAGRMAIAVRRPRPPEGLPTAISHH